MPISKIKPYLVAIGLVGLAYPLSVLLLPWGILATPSPFFTAAVVITAWYGGMAPALFGALLAAITRQLFLIHSTGKAALDFDDLVQVVLFLLVAFLIGSLFRRLAAVNAGLERQVESRTRELIAANQQLLEAIEKQKRIEEERQKFEDVARSKEQLALLGELASEVAHELRNPLQGVMSYLQLARMSAGDREELNLLLQQADDGLQSIDRVAARLLDLSRRDSEPTSASVLEPIIEKACDFVKPRADKLGVKIKCSLEAGLPKVQVNPAQTMGIFLNLLKNSLDACKAGGTISVEGRLQKNKPEMVELLISDTGTGIAANIRDIVFEPFFTTKPAGEGTGLGLAMAKRALEGYGGYIGIMDSGPSGTTMRLGLPVASVKNIDLDMNGEIIA